MAKMNIFLAWCQLLRLHKPVGVYLVLWPSLLGLFHGAYIDTATFPQTWHIALFVLGAFASRSAGCIANDLWDRDIDPNVERTKNRPLASGVITPRSALWVMLMLFVACAIIALAMGVIVVAIVAVPWIMLYPLAKRITGQPQLVLAIAFSFGIPMGYAVYGHLISVHWIPLWLANMVWIYAYDTIYAMADKQDDAHVGIGSSALYWGRYDFVAVGIAQLLTLVLLYWWMRQVVDDVALVSNSPHVGSVSLWLALFLVAVGFVWQQWYIRTRTIARCIVAFTSNHYLQFVLLVALVTSFMWC